MPSTRRVRAAGAVLAGTVVLTSACSTSAQGSASPAGLGSAPGGSTADDSITAMLALLPPMDADELGIVSVSRWHAAAEAYGVPIPSPDTEDDDLLGFLSDLTIGEGGLVQASEVVGLRSSATRSAEEFGFGLQQVSADASAGTPPRVHQAARGEFDPDAVGEATRSGPLADVVEEDDVAGVPVLRWLDDLEVDLQLVNALSPVGGAGRLAVPDAATLLYAGYDEGIEGLVDAAQGGASLADDEDLAAVAAALDGEEVLSAQLTYRPDGSDLTYEAVGIGVTWDGDGGVVLAYSTGSDGDAQFLAEDVEELLTSGSTLGNGRPWSELLSDPEIRTEGSTVVVTTTVETPTARWAQFLFRQENLF